MCKCKCKSLFRHGESSVKLIIKIKTALHDCRVGIRYLRYFLNNPFKLPSRTNAFLILGQAVPQTGPAVTKTSF